LYSSVRIIRIIKLRMMMWAGHVARMGEKRTAYIFLKENEREGYHKEDQDVGGSITS
jgi:hypothetical protein